MICLGRDFWYAWVDISVMLYSVFQHTPVSERVIAGFDLCFVRIWPPKGRNSAWAHDS